MLSLIVWGLCVGEKPQKRLENRLARITLTTSRIEMQFSRLTSRRRITSWLQLYTRNSWLDSLIARSKIVFEAWNIGSWDAVHVRSDRVSRWYLWIGPNVLVNFRKFVVGREMRSGDSNLLPAYEAGSQKSCVSFWCYRCRLQSPVEVLLFSCFSAWERYIFVSRDNGPFSAFVHR